MTLLLSICQSLWQVNRHHLLETKYGGPPRPHGLSGGTNGVGLEGVRGVDYWQSGTRQGLSRLDPLAQIPSGWLTGRR